MTTTGMDMGHEDEFVGGGEEMIGVGGDEDLDLEGDTGDLGGPDDDLDEDV